MVGTIGTLAEAKEGKAEREADALRVVTKARSARAGPATLLGDPRKLCFFGRSFKRVAGSMALKFELQTRVSVRIACVGAHFKEEQKRQSCVWSCLVESQ